MGRAKKENFKRTESLLYNRKWIELGIKNMKEELEDEIKEMLLNYGVGSINPGAEHFNTNKVSSVTENSAIDRIESKKSRDLKDRIQSSKDLIEKIDLVVKELNENEQEIIKLYYFKEMRNDKVVADKVGYIPEYVGKLRRKAVSLISIGLGHSISSECKIYKVS